MDRLPELDEQERLCRHCGMREGVHRYGDEACQNLRWKCGNGQLQWVDGLYFEEWKLER